jgi:hypothetical protein
VHANDDYCAKAGALKTDCDKLIDHIVKQQSLSTASSSSSSNSATTPTEDPVLTGLKTDLGEAVVTSLRGALDLKEIKTLRDQLGKVRLVRYTGSLKPEGLKTLITNSMPGDQLKALADLITDDKVKKLEVKALVALVPEMTAGKFSEFLAETDVDFVKTYGELNGAGPILKNSVSHFGTAGKTGKIFNHAVTAGMPATECATGRRCWLAPEDEFARAGCRPRGSARRDERAGRRLHARAALQQLIDPALLGV